MAFFKTSLCLSGQTLAGAISDIIYSASISRSPVDLTHPAGTLSKGPLPQGGEELAPSTSILAVVPWPLLAALQGLAMPISPPTAVVLQPQQEDAHRDAPGAPGARGQGFCASGHYRTPSYLRPLLSRPGDKADLSNT